MKLRILITIIVLAAVAAVLVIPNGGPTIAESGKSAPPVLVVINQESPVSVEAGEYYAKKRQIPKKKICRLHCPETEWANEEEYLKIRSAIRSHLENNKIKDEIDYIVLTKGVPIAARVNDKIISVDSALTVLWMDEPERPTPNPFFTRKSAFSHSEYGIYLVTRLDGYTTADAKRLVDLSLAAKPQKGLFLFDLDPSREDNKDYSWLNKSQRTAIEVLEARGMKCKGVSDEFAGGEKDLMGYYTWGSNNPKFDQKKYAGNTFHPGAIAETVVSTSGRTFAKVKEGQSVITDLIASGVTGVKGYVSEPYAVSIAQAHMLFDRYTSGSNLAESFYAASRFLNWTDVVIGDPLCAPYAGEE